MDQVMQVAVVAVAGGLCSVALRKQVPEFSLVIGLVTAALLLGWVATLLKQAVVFLRQLGTLAGLSDELVAPLLKTVAIGVVTKITAELCRDAGENGVGAAAEFAGGVAAISAAIPLMQQVLASLQEML